jgi:hypothetical protein
MGITSRIVYDLSVGHWDGFLLKCVREGQGILLADVTEEFLAVVPSSQRSFASGRLGSVDSPCAEGSGYVEGV